MAEYKIIEPTIFTSNKLFIQQVLSYKYFYIILIFLFLLGAYIYNKTSESEYEVYAAIMFKKNETSSMLGSGELFRGIESIQAYNAIEDGINNFQSFSMVYSTLDKLNLGIGYFSEAGKIFKSKRELYKNLPFRVSFNKLHVQPVDTKFYIEILSDSTFRISAKKSRAILLNYVDNEIVNKYFPINIEGIFRFNQIITLDYISLSINKNKDYKPDESTRENDLKYYFVLYNPDLMSKEYLKNLVIYRASPSSSMLNIKFRGENLEKSIAFVNSYMNYFFEDNLARKNTIAINTINFIDAQIAGISDSLVRSESKIENFRASNQVMNLTYQGQTSYDKLQQIEKERNALQTQERYYTYILEYFRTIPEVTGLVPPSAMNVQNEVINQLIVELLKLDSERANIKSLRGEKNLFLAEIENKIRLQKQYIAEIVTSNLNTLKQTLDLLSYQSDKLSKEISLLPKRELNMGSIQRKFKIDDAIYTYLLQKKSEATISLASNYPDYEMFEPAREATSYQRAPKPIRNYLIAFILALIIPSSIMILKNLINIKISSTEYIHQVINRPPITTIFSVPGKVKNSLIDNPGSSSFESFRTLRSTIFRKFFFLKTKVILITSGQPQDGKSFLALNLAISIAMVSKKVLIIDADLRRPVLHTKLKLENKTGLSNFISGNRTLDEIISNTTIENLSFIPAGPAMPNITEAIESGGMDSLIESVKERFEYIIIDTSPAGFIAEALLMTRYADYILLVVRNNATLKETFENVITSFNSYNVSNYDVVLNDKSMDDSHQGLYSYYKYDKIHNKIT
jgi:tyrosine-protein kinase Etk/Wzc